MLYTTKPPTRSSRGRCFPARSTRCTKALTSGRGLESSAARRFLEISILNVDKPPLDFIDIEQRTRLFAAHDEVWLSRASRFSEKARLFPGATFVVGADTIERIGQPRYYGGEVGAMNEALDAIAAAGCRFLVFGRVAAGNFRQLADLNLPKALAAICREVPESVFRDDVSSTKLRAKSHDE